MPNKDAFTYLKKNSENDKYDLWRCDAKTGQSSLFIRNEELDGLGAAKREKRFSLSSYTWSPDGESILVPAHKDLFLFDLKSRKLLRLTEDDEEERDPTFSPDGKKLAYLKRQNLAVFDIATKQEKQLTTEGNDDILIGRFDWVYEEEFSIRTGFEWSPDSKYISYFRLDQSGEPDFPIVDFIPVHNTATPMKYPKAGDANALVKIGVVDVTTANTVWMDRSAGPDDYLTRTKWLPDSRELAITYVNRDQNHLELLFANAADGLSRVILTEEVTNGWLDSERSPLFVPGTSQFLWPSEQDGFEHLYLLDYTGKKIRQLTEGSWELGNIIRFVPERRQVFFSAAKDRYEETHLYSIGTDGKNLRQLTVDSGSHSAVVASSGRYFIDTFSNYNTPTRQTLCDENGRLVTVLADGQIKALAEVKLPKTEFFTFTSSNGDVLQAYLIKPVDFDSTQKYPVLMYTYAGPGSQVVTNRWSGASALWYTLLTQKGYLIFAVDGRGSANRGRGWKHQVYRRLGDVEIQDQIEGAKYLRSLPFVDQDRIGIWGWSYGGYSTIMCLLKGAEFFKVGVAVAPVTDWKNYDTIYTERYMDQPKDNEAGYQESSALFHAKKLKGKLLLIHGSSDDNVHLANTLQLAEAFQNARIPFDLMIYPRKTHGIGGRDTRVHLYEKVTQYLLENL